VIKPGKKAPNPILHEIRGFKYTHNQRAVFFGYRKPVFFSEYFFPLGIFLTVRQFLKLFLKRREGQKSTYFFRLP
jgi:hypothetical protein